MRVFTENHKFHYEIENLTRVFFPNEKIEIIKGGFYGDKTEPFIITRVEEKNGDTRLFCSISSEGVNIEKEKTLAPVSFDDETERSLAVLLFDVLSEYTGITPPWGILTGVRPIKLFRKLTEELGAEGAEEYFKGRLLVNDEKIRLSSVTEKNEKRIIETSTPNSFSLYVSIPFCPSRCSYCSFVSQSVEKSLKLIEPYVELLCREIEMTGKLAAELSLELQSVYIGGGTPTVLSPEQLRAVMGAIVRSFDMSRCREFTVEAGRPDTVTNERLAAIKECGADRISINPQTLNDEILRSIGRNHTADEFYKAYETARRCGFDHINTDLIAGLPNEGAESFRKTLDKITALAPKSITVHTLSMKRSSRLTAQGVELLRRDAAVAEDMHRYCSEILPALGYEPYYLYRQSRMVGNLENVGWSQKGSEGIYNVFIMDETHSILGCGAGATTKLKQPGGAYIERIFNYKYPYEYLKGFDEMLRRKDRIREFYNEYGF